MLAWWNRRLLWLVLLAQVVAMVGMLVGVVFPLAKRSAQDVAGVMLVAAKTWEELAEDRRGAFAQSLLEDAGVRIGPLPGGEEEEMAFWYPGRWGYGRWVAEALQARGEEAFRVQVVHEQVQVRIRVDSEWVDLSAPSPRLGGLVALLLALGVLGMLAVGLALFWQARWRHQTVRREVLLAGLSHDLRTPMTRLRLRLSLLTGVDDTERVALMRALTQMDEMIELSLQLVRANPGAPMVMDWQVWLEWLQQAYAQVRWRLDDGVPDQLVHGVLLRRVVQNLLDNALVHGQGEVQVVVSVQAGRWRLCVRDAGEGVPESVWRQVQAGDRPVAQGHGLGLLTSVWLAEAAGVVLWRQRDGHLCVSLPVPA